MKFIFVNISIVFTVIIFYGCSDKIFYAEKEKVAIQQLIAKETASYYKQDFETWKNTYVNAPHFRSYGYWVGYDEKVRSYNGFDTLKSFKKNSLKKTATVWRNSIEEKSNENFRIYPEFAWYTFDQVSYDSSRTKVLGRSVETRILGKQNSEWKIAYLGFHYLPDSAAKN